MIINGEKYACEACVRGHRVSSCSHSERQLLHVNKKGRPVSQCHHCRTLRKARSQHVKCECHDKSHAKEDCPHLKDLPAGPDPHTCCCGHGARCTCSLKKEHLLDTVPEDIAHIIQPTKEPQKPRISNMNSHESKATVFSNGHHKPVHKFNDAHNHCGAPYRVPSRSHTIHGHREIAQRSSDSLPLTNRTSLHQESPLHNVTSAPQQGRQVKSEHSSPLLGPIKTSSIPAFDVVIPPLSPNAYSYSPFDTQSPSIQPGVHPDFHIPENIPDSWFTTYDEVQDFGSAPCPNGVDMGSVDWASFGFGGNMENANTSVYPVGSNGYMSTQSASYATSFEHLNRPNQPALNSSSGEVSEVDEAQGTYRPSNLRTISHASNDISSQGGDDQSESYRLSSASSYFGTPSGNMLASNLEDLDIDKFIAEQKQRNLQAQQSHTPEQALSQPQSQQRTPPQQQQQAKPQQHVPGSNPGYPFPSKQWTTEHPYTIHEAQAYAHMGIDNENPLFDRRAVMSRTSMGEDPMWCSAPDDSSGFELDDEREDEAWVR